MLYIRKVQYTEYSTPLHILQRVRVENTTRWSAQEIALLCTALRHFGNKPADVAKTLACKTEAQVLNMHCGKYTVHRYYY